MQNWRGRALSPAGVPGKAALHKNESIHMIPMYDYSVILLIVLGVATGPFVPRAFLVVRFQAVCRDLRSTLQKHRCALSTIDLEMSPPF